jgi:formate dehydrogenase subunit delta
MNIDLLIKMANEIGDFFTGTGDQAEAVQAVANHLKRYWEPRMRAQMLRYYEERAGAGLSDVARGAVAVLHEASKSAAPTPPVPPTAAAPPVPPAAPKSADR